MIVIIKLSDDPEFVITAYIAHDYTAACTFIRNDANLQSYKELKEHQVPAREVHHPNCETFQVGNSTYHIHFKPTMLIY